MPNIAGLFTAFFWATSDYLAGLASRRTQAFTTACALSVSQIIVALPIALLTHAQLRKVDFAWGLLAGVFGMAAWVLFLYLFANKKMSIVSPIAAVTLGVVPVTASVVLGKIPTALGWMGIAVGIIGIALISTNPGDNKPSDSRHVVPFAILAGAGFGLMTVFEGRTSTASGVWPIVAMNCVGALLVPLSMRRSRWSFDALSFRLLIGATLLSVIGHSLVLYALRNGNLGIVGMLAAQQPLFILALSHYFQGERLTKLQYFGVGISSIAIGLLAFA